MFLFLFSETYYSGYGRLKSSEFNWNACQPQPTLFPLVRFETFSPESPSLAVFRDCYGGWFSSPWFNNSINKPISFSVGNMLVSCVSHARESLTNTLSGRKHSCGQSMSLNPLSSSLILQSKLSSLKDKDDGAKPASVTIDTIGRIWLTVGLLHMHIAVCLPSVSPGWWHMHKCLRINTKWLK